jgi:hypothetical protein
MQYELVLLSPNELRFNNFIDLKTTFPGFINYYDDLSTEKYIMRTLIKKNKNCRCWNPSHIISRKNKLVLFNYELTNLENKKKYPQKH